MLPPELPPELPQSDSIVLIFPWVFMLDTETSNALFRLTPILARVVSVEMVEEDGKYVPVALVIYNKREYTVNAMDVIVVTNRN